jgi:hypothetical protein
MAAFVKQKSALSVAGMTAFTGPHEKSTSPK